MTFTLQSIKNRVNSGVAQHDFVYLLAIGDYFDGLTQLSLTPATNSLK